MASHAKNNVPVSRVDQLLDEARHGSTAAIGRLFESARAYLLFLANKELPSALRAKLGASDVVQETAIDVHRDFPRFAGTTSEEFYGWLRSILQNNVLDAVRRYEVSQKRDVAKETSLTAIATPGEHGPRAHRLLAAPARPPDGSIIRREDAAAVTAVLARLPDDYRIVLHLRYWDGLTFNQIGDRFGRSAEAVRKLWYRAVQRLQAELHAPVDHGNHEKAGPMHDAQRHSQPRT